ncbi:MAG: sulfotransferase [Okeania sp. SIO3I5]|uniref:sulfotransferase family protein n=1 Tax=Okeania sp. SIO3I5 TaxID=2607805 RepID=UPI0013BA85DD|nr:sulfotransferase [Okeania sp. SIO3I5]NEQ35484.1 sulfotransferase [Okeania sp. SIO3I5]
MTAKFLNIQNKPRTNPRALAKLEDFQYLEGENIDSQIIINSPNISLYCLEPASQQGIFVETPLDVEISDYPFVYNTQFEYAERLIAVPYQDLFDLAKSIRNYTQNLILIYSVGRCGSTLLSKVFNQLDYVLSLSEPDVFCYLVGLRTPDGSLDTQIRELLNICTRLTCQPTPKIKPSWCVIKPRSFCIEIADLMYELFPHAKVIFLYRSAADVIPSFIRAHEDVRPLIQGLEDNLDYYSRFFPLIKSYSDFIDFSDPNAVDIYSILWLSAMERYLELYQKGVPMLALRYEDLVKSPQQMIASIFEYCGLPNSEVTNACKVFEQDSQGGSHLSRERTRKHQLTESEMIEVNQKIYRLLEKHPEIRTPDYIIPGTLGHNI